MSQTTVNWMFVAGGGLFVISFICLRYGKSKRWAAAGMVLAILIALPWLVGTAFLVLFYLFLSIPGARL